MKEVNCKRKGNDRKAKEIKKIFMFDFYWKALIIQARIS
jgi:hypothetical protein